MNGAIEVDGLSLSWRSWGEGDPVLLICGTGDVSSSFEPLGEELADAGYRAISYDSRDTGTSSRVARSYTPRDLAADSAGILEALQIESAHILVFSLGGATAMELAIARPELVRSLILLSTWGRSDRAFRHQMRNWQCARRATIGDEHAFLTALNPWLFSHSTLDDQELLRDISREWLTEPFQEPDAFIRQTEADIAHDALERLSSIEQPALVIVGEDDICTPPRAALQLVDGISDSRLAMIPRAGHCALFEQPEAVHSAVLDFLSRAG